MLHFGDIYYADLSQVMRGNHIQTGRRPVIVVSNDICNYFSWAITIVPLTSRLKRPDIPTHVMIKEDGLKCLSMALCEQITTVDKDLLTEKICSVKKAKTLNKIRKGIMVQINSTDFQLNMTSKASRNYISCINEIKKNEMQEKVIINDRTYLWLGRICACNKSGSTKSDWCRNNGVSYKTFMNRQTQFRQLGLI